MPNPNAEYVYSSNSETFEGLKFSTREEALEAGKKALGSFATHVYTAKIDQYHFVTEFTPDVGMFLDEIRDRILDHMGEEASQNFEPTEEQRTDLEQRLQAMLADWEKVHGIQLWFTAGDIQEHPIVHEDTITRDGGSMKAK